MLGKIADKGRLSVCPPESASTVISSASGTRRARSASSRVSRPGRDQRVEHLLRGRGEEEPRRLGTRDLGEEVVPPLHASGGVGGEPRCGIPHHGEREPHERRGRDPPHAPPQVDLDGRILERRLLRGVDEVRPPRGIGPQFAGELRDRVLDARGVEPGRPEEPEKAGARRLDHHADRRETVGHLPDHVREADAVHFAKGPIPQPLGVEGGENGGHRGVDGIRRSSDRIGEQDAEPALLVIEYRR